MRTDPITAALIIAIFAIIFCGVMSCRDINENATKCRERGGVLVKAAGVGYACVHNGALR